MWGITDNVDKDKKCTDEVCGKCDNRSRVLVTSIHDVTLIQIEQNTHIKSGNFYVTTLRIYNADNQVFTIDCIGHHDNKPFLDVSD